MESWTDMTGREGTGNCLQIIGTEVENEPKITAKWCTQCQLNVRDESGQEKSGDVETGYQESLYLRILFLSYLALTSTPLKKTGRGGTGLKLYQMAVREINI